MPTTTAGPIAASLPVVLESGAVAAQQPPTSATAFSAGYVNYVDIKLEGVHHLPSNWLSAGLTSASVTGATAATTAPTATASATPQLNNAGSPAHAAGGGEEEATEVAYAYHPFRYEVTLSLPADAAAPAAAGASQHDTEASVPSDAVRAEEQATPAAAAADTAPAPSPSVVVAAAFTRGRLLQLSPAYMAYIANAEPPPVCGVDDAAPLHDVPAAIDADDIHHAADVCKEGNNTDRSAEDDQQQQHQEQHPPAILWVVTDRTDDAVRGSGNSNAHIGSLTGGGSSLTSAGGNNAGTSLVAAKRRLKSTASGGGGGGAGGASTFATAAAVAAGGNSSSDKAAAAVPGAPPPPLPDTNEAPPCVVRVPLTAAQEAYLDSLLHSGAPLELRLRRTLRAGCPAEWEDLNASYYEAVIPVTLAGLSVPGSTQLKAEVPLQPAYLYDAGRTSSLMSGGGAGWGAAAMPGSSAPTAAAAASASAAAASASAAAAAAATGAAGGERPDRATNANTNGNKKRAVSRKTRQTVPGLLVDEPDRSAPHPYALAGTTARLSLTFQRTLTRLVSDRIRPTISPAQLIPSRPVPTVAAATAADAQARLRHALRAMAQQLSQDVREVALQQLSSSARANDHSSSGVKSAAWRAQFVAVLQSTGQLAAFKSQLTPLVSQLVQERLRVHPAASPEEVARASNELYVQLMDMLHATLRGLCDSDGHDQNGEAKETHDLELRWRALEAEVSGEVALAATLYHSRLATHVGDAASWAALWVDCGLYYQRINEVAKAEQCYREAIACDVSCVAALLDYGVWLLANDRLDEAAVFVHAVVDVAPTHVLGWGCVALLADLRELAVRAGSPGAAAEQAKWRREHHLALRRAVECVEQQQRRVWGGASATVAAVAVLACDPTCDRADTPSEEQVYLTVASYLVQLHQPDLANVCLARCRPGEPDVELLYAHLFTQGGQYEEALKAIDAAAGSKQHANSPAAADTCVLLRAECLAALGQASEAVTLYKQALAPSTPSTTSTTTATAAAAGCDGDVVATSTAPSYLPELAARWRDDVLHRRTTTAAGSAELLSARTTEAACLLRLRAYVRLCNTLLAEGRYKDALGAVTLALQVWPNCSVLWLGAGIAYYRAGDFTAAEECLQESNTLDPSNARAWVYLTLLCVRLQHTGVEEMVQQVMGLHLDDAALWAELGRTLLSTALYPRLSVACLRRAAALARAASSSGKGSSTAAVPTTSSAAAVAAALLPSTLYHLAHALMDIQQWEEAQRLLDEVAAANGGNEVLRGKAEEELAMLRAA